MDRRDLTPRKTPSELAVERLEARKGVGGSVRLAVGGGTVEITSLARRTAKGAEILEIFVSSPEGGDPHFRIINLPEPVDGDHLRAVAAVLARHGGRQAVGSSRLVARPSGTNGGRD